MKNILEMLVCFKEENREDVIEGGLLNDLLKNDPYFKNLINKVENKKNMKKYMNLYTFNQFIL